MEDSALYFFTDHVHDLRFCCAACRKTPRNQFTDYTAHQEGMGGDIVPPFVPGAPGGVAAARNAAPLYSNIVDRYSNRNVCFSCGFDEEDGHTSRMCPHPTRGDAPTTRKQTIAAMPSYTSTQDMMLALKQSTRRSFQPSDGVGWSR
jgi:hypothetical protein